MEQYRFTLVWEDFSGPHFVNFKALSKDLHSCLHANKLPYQRSKTGGFFAEIKCDIVNIKGRLSFCSRSGIFSQQYFRQVPCRHSMCLKIDEMYCGLSLVEQKTA
jgi:hypothetical protein